MSAPIRRQLWPQPRGKRYPQIELIAVDASSKLLRREEEHVLAALLAQPFRSRIWRSFFEMLTRDIPSWTKTLISAAVTCQFDVTQEAES